MFARVLVGDDLSLAIKPVLACVGALRRLGTREVVLVHALGIRHLDEMQHAVAPLVEPRLGARRRAIEELGVLASLEIAPGIPAPEVVRIARERHASLVVLGAQSSRPRELLLGSVGVQVLYRCDIPVLVCKAAAADLGEHILYATDLTPAADRGLDFVVQLYLGSVSHGVARGSSVPVLLVPPGPGASRER